LKYLLPVRGRFTRSFSEGKISWDSLNFAVFSIHPVYAALAKLQSERRTRIPPPYSSPLLTPEPAGHLGFAFPLAKRDYHCFKKGQRALGNGARLGFCLDPMFVSPAHVRAGFVLSSERETWNVLITICN
jgi:hypothetical protein